jgi:hypothetical protein
VALKKTFLDAKCAAAKAKLAEAGAGVEVK